MSPEPGSGRRQEARHPLRAGRLAAAPVAALVAAVVLGGIVGGASLALLSVAVADEASPLPVVGAVVSGVMTAVLVWVIGLCLAAWRLFPRGRRLGAVGLSLVAAGVLAVGLPLVLEVIEDSTGVAVPGAVRWTLLLVPVAAVTSGAFVLWQRLGSRPLLHSGESDETSSSGHLGLPKE